MACEAVKPSVTSHRPPCSAAVCPWSQHQFFLGTASKCGRIWAKKFPRAELGGEKLHPHITGQGDDLAQPCFVRGPRSVCREIMCLSDTDQCVCARQPLFGGEIPLPHFCAHFIKVNAGWNTWRLTYASSCIVIPQN